MSLQSLAPDVIHNIALALATIDPLSPPSNLTPLLQSSSTLYNLLSARSNPHLYADIFKDSFDMAALRRRYPAQVTATHLTQELARRWTVLRRIRALALEGPSGYNWSPRRYTTALLIEDLTTAYLMFTESDGKNAILLLRYALIEKYLDAYSMARLQPVHKEPQMPAESHATSLFMWLAWMVTDFRNLLNTPDARSITWLSTAYMLGTFCYKNSYAPWTIPTLPIPSPSASPARSTPSPPPTVNNASPYFIADLTPRELPVITIQYLGRPLTLTSPLTSHAATLIYFAQLQKTSVERPPPPPQQFLAQLEHREVVENRASSGASTLNRILPHAVDAVKGRQSWAPDYMHVKFASLARSEAWDDEVARLRTCWNPFEMTRELGVPKYAWTKGSLAGAWDGRFVLGDLDSYRNIMQGANAINTLEDAMILQDLQSWGIQEHYHVSPRSEAYAARSLGSAFRRRTLGPAIPIGRPSSAFIPDWVRIERGRDAANGSYGLDVWDGRAPPADGNVAWYESFSGPMEGNDVGLSSTTTGIEEEEEFEDEDGEPCIKILITGHTIPRPAYVPVTHPSMMGELSTVMGTVRKWDGLITLNAVPPEGTNGAWTWRGYLVGDGNFVGRWREGGMDVRRNAYEGVFVMRRRVPDA